MNWNTNNFQVGRSEKDPVILKYFKRVFMNDRIFVTGICSCGN
jgi:hypothetical protein